MLAGAKPSKLRDCSLAEHNQAWRIHEYHLLTPPGELNSGTSLAIDRDPLTILPAGDPLLAYVPPNVVITEDNGALSFTLPSSFSSSPYSSPPPTYVQYNALEHKNYSAEEHEAYRRRVQDIILTGDGHSGWGEFRLVGRVRPCDGFVSILKEYVSVSILQHNHIRIHPPLFSSSSPPTFIATLQTFLGITLCTDSQISESQTGGDRGRWLYRGFVIGGGDSPSAERSGSLDAYIAGRWRDTLTPAETHGYEGAFALSRRVVRI